MTSDLTERQFGELKPIERGPNYRRAPTWLCRCACGTEKMIRQDHLLAGAVVSCGCSRRARLGRRSTRHGHTAGGARPAEHGIWMRMIRRCTVPSDSSWEHYGGRGITVSDEWRDSYSAFLADMGPRPSSDYSLERNDNDGPYSKGNCRWATRIEQANNKRSNALVTIRGRTQTMAQWKREIGIEQANLTAATLRAVIAFLDPPT